MQDKAHRSQKWFCYTRFFQGHIYSFHISGLECSRDYSWSMPFSTHSCIGQVKLKLSGHITPAVVPVRSRLDLNCAGEAGKTVDCIISYNLSHDQDALQCRRLPKYAEENHWIFWHKSDSRRWIDVICISDSSGKLYKLINVIQPHASLPKCVSNYFQNS